VFNFFQTITKIFTPNIFKLNILNNLKNDFMKYTIMDIRKDKKHLNLAVWPSGKAVDCKSSIPSSNLGAALKNFNYSIVFRFESNYSLDKIMKSFWECGEIGRHDRLKIYCLLRGVRVQVPPFPINFICLCLYL
jgi:hypothetical protein